MNRLNKYNINDREEAKERDLKTLQVEVWCKAGKVEKVNESGHLGTLLMPETSSNVFEVVGAYGRPISKIPVKFELKSLGEVKQKTKIVEGMHNSLRNFNAVTFIPAEKLALLTVKEIEIFGHTNWAYIQSLFNDTTVDGKVIPGWTPKVHTALQDAAITIYNAEGIPAFAQEHNTILVDGDHADDASAILTVNGKEFTVGGQYYFATSYSLCQGYNKYSFTWMNVPVTFLDEPKEIVVPVKPLEITK